MASILLNPGFFATYAVVQAFVLLLLFRLLEPFDRPPLFAMLLLALWGGTVAALIAGVGNEAVKAAIPDDARQVFGDSIAPPVVEECAKGLALVVAVIASRKLIDDVGGWRFEGVTAGMICGAAVGIGFSFTEDFFYFVNHATDDGVRAGADIYLGRRDFFGPTALHHPLFTAAFGAGVGAATASSGWRGRIGWPLAGLAVAILIHAVNNGLIELLILVQHGLNDATDWVAGGRVPASVEQTADDANSVLVLLDYTYIVAVLAIGFLLHRRARTAVAEALEPDVESGLISEEDRVEVCGFGTRANTYVRLFLSGQRERLRRTRQWHREVARLGTARVRVAKEPGEQGSLTEARRRLIAAKGVSAQPGKAPMPELQIIGRGRELSELSELLSTEARQVTITGPGGTGKTRLAAELASAIGDRFAHGTYFVDLSTLTAADQVPVAIAGALELTLAPGEEPGAWLGRLLRDRELLLVLDNFEHLATAAPLVTAIVRAAPHLRIAVTSRRVLGIPGESEYHLEPLPVASAGGGPSTAAKLFMERAVGPAGGGDGPEDLALIEAICARVDGLPLAIELVASRTRAFSLTTISRRLDSVLDLAATESPALPERQRTLRGAIAWSEDLLGTHTRELFVGLAQFPAGCRLSSLEHEDDDASLTKGLQTLVESNLLRMALDPDGEPRYRMLATVRDFALEQLGRATVPPPVSVARCCGALVQAMAGDGQWRPEYLPILDLERPNLSIALEEFEQRGEPEEALRMMVVLGPLWERGAIAEARQILDRLIAAVSQIRSPTLPRGRQLAGRLALLQGEYHRASELLKSALAGSGDDSEMRFSCDLQLGWVETFLGNLEGAQTKFAHALTAAPDLGPRERAQASLGLGRVAAERGDIEAGRAMVSQSIRLWEEAGDPRGATGARSAQARISLLGGDPQESESRARAALEQAGQLGDQLRQAEAMFPLASSLFLQNRIKEAAGVSEERLEVCRELGDRLGIAEVLDLAGLLAKFSGDNAAAARGVSTANALRSRTGAERWPFERSLIEKRLGTSERSGSSPAAGDLASASALANETLRAVLALGA